MGLQGTLGIPRGTRGIEDAGIAVRVDGDFGQGATVIAERFIGDRTLRGLEAHGDEGRVARQLRLILDARIALLVEEEELWLRVAQPIAHLRGHPPGVHAHDRGADARDCPVNEHELGVVPHGDGDPIPRRYAIFHEPGGNGGHLLMGLGIGPALVLVDKVFALSKLLGGQPEFAQAGRGVLVGLRGDPPDVDRGDLKVALGPRKRLPNLLKLCVHPHLPYQ